MLVDDQQVVLWAVQKLIAEHHPQLEVVATVCDTGDAMAQARTCLPDVIVLDLNLGAGAGARLLPLLHEEIAARVLLYTTPLDDAAIDHAMHEGARGLVRKDEAPHLLLMAIRRVHEGEIWVDRKTTSRLLSELSQGGRLGLASKPQSRLNVLTPREFGVIETMATLPGARNKQIADQLGISENTLRNHLSAIFDKLDVHSRFELFSYATKHVATCTRI